MAQAYEYQVLSVQYGRVPFVNAGWLGRTPLGGGRETGELLESCPQVREYLQTAGREGWELVAVASHPQENPADVRDTLYLKRPSW